ncbi:MAG: hypothetical protein ACTSPI_12685, partial [Candidatus Heimdallarchaeaceae archaeon]
MKLLFVSIVAFLSAIVSLATPQLIKYIIDEAIPNKDILLVWLLGGGVLLTAIIGGVLFYLTRFYSSVYAQRII